MSDEIKIESGKRIRAAREACGLKLADVHAQLPWLTVSRLSNWEQGTRMIGIDEAKKLASVLRVSAGYILTLEDVPIDPKERALLELYRGMDQRGRETVIRVAESESTYQVDLQEKPPRVGAA